MLEEEAQRAMLTQVLATESGEIERKLAKSWLPRAALTLSGQPSPLLIAILAHDKLRPLQQLVE